MAVVQKMQKISENKYKNNMQLHFGINKAEKHKLEKKNWSKYGIIDHKTINKSFKNIITRLYE